MCTPDAHRTGEDLGHADHLAGAQAGRAGDACDLAEAVDEQRRGLLGRELASPEQRERPATAELGELLLPTHPQDQVVDTVLGGGSCIQVARIRGHVTGGHRRSEASGIVLHPSK